MSSIELARTHRQAAAESLLDARVDFILDEIGLSEDRVLELAVGPAARERLKGILKRLARKKHPFTQCMRDLAKHRSELPLESRRRICGRLKSMIKGTGRVKALALSEDDSGCELIDDDVAKLLTAVDGEALASFEQASIVNLAVLTSKRRKELPKTAFVFPKEKRYPIHDIAHARNALARSSGKPEEAAVKTAVYKRYPQLRPKKKES